MLESVLNDIKRIYKKGDIRYSLNKYVDKDYWTSTIRKNLNNYSIENLTDFSYSSCFTIFINISETDVRVGTPEFDNYVISFGVLYRLNLQISILAPYSTFKYVKYEYVDNKINYNESYLPFLEQHSVLGTEVKRFLNLYNLKLLDEKVLSTEIQDVVLELRENNVTVYHCLFEDGY